MDETTRKEIQRIAAQTLRDAGLTEPPLSVEALLEHDADTAETLDPAYQADLEEEANYAVARLLFLGDGFQSPFGRLDPHSTPE